MGDLLQLEEFDWDEGNIDKNWIKHGIYYKECEEIFDDVFLLVLPDELHSQKEVRFHALGRTNNNRFLFISFTVRTKVVWFVKTVNVDNLDTLFAVRKVSKLFYHSTF